MNLECLLEAAIEVPQKPGVFRIDAGALRALLLELVRVAEAKEGPYISIKDVTQKLTNDFDELQMRVEQLEVQFEDLHEAHSPLAKLEDDVSEIKENERIISDSINLLASSVQTIQDQLDGMMGDDSGELLSTQAISDLLDRVTAIEVQLNAHSPKKLSPPRRTSSQAGKRVSIRKQRFSTVVDVRNNISMLYKKFSDPSPPLFLESKVDVGTPFIELKQQVTELGLQYVTALEDFLTALKEKQSIQPKMLQELLVIFSGTSVDFFRLLVDAFEESKSLTVSSFIKILHFIMHSAFNCKTLELLVNTLASESSYLKLPALTDLLLSVREIDASTAANLVSFLEILVNCDGLIDFLPQIIELKSFSKEAIKSIAEEFHFTKGSTLQEIVKVMDKMSPSELNEMMQMLITIPGYIGELMYSLSKPPTLSAQRTLEHLICLPNDAPHLLAEIVGIVSSNPVFKRDVISMLNRLLELSSAMEIESRTVNGFYHLLEKLLNTESISLRCIGEVFALIKEDNDLTLDAVSALVKFSRDSPKQYVEAFMDLLRILVACPEIKTEGFQRVLRLMEKAKFISYSNLQDLLEVMLKSGLLKKDIFGKLIVVFHESRLNSPYIVNEFVCKLHAVEFLTLDDLAHALGGLQASQRPYEEALERLYRREQDLNEELKDRDQTSQGIQLLQARSEETLQFPKEVTFKESVISEQSGSSHHLDQLASAQSVQVTEEVKALMQNLQKELNDLQATVAGLMEEKVPEKLPKIQIMSDQMIKSFCPKAGWKTRSLSDIGSISATRARSSCSSPPQYRESELEGSRAREQYFENQFAHMVVLEDALKNGLEKLDVLFQRLEDHILFSITKSWLQQNQQSMEARMNTLCKHPNFWEGFFIKQGKEVMCKHRYERLAGLVSVKAENDELVEFKDAVKQQLHNFIRKTIPTGPAGSKLQMKVNCLSCDKKSVTGAVYGERALPQGPAFPPVFSHRPYTVYQMNLIRRHAKSLKEGNADKSAFYSIPRQCGGQHTTMDVRHTFTYEFSQKENCAGDINEMSGGVTCTTNSSSVRGPRSTDVLNPRPPNASRQ